MSLCVWTTTYSHPHIPHNRSIIMELRDSKHVSLTKNRVHELAWWGHIFFFVVEKTASTFSIITER